MHLLQLLRIRAKRLRRALGNTLNHRILFLAGFLLLLMCLHSVAMVLLEGLSWGDAAWLTITTATTVGYGDISAATPAGRWATGLLMYGGGIFVLAQLAGLVFEAAQAASDERLNGKTELNGKNHIVIFGWRQDFLLTVVREIRESMLPLAEADIFIVSPQLQQLPTELRDLNVRHVSGPLYESSTLRKASLGTAARFVILPDSDGPDADFVSADLASRLRAGHPDTPIIVSCLQPQMETIAAANGADDTLAFDDSYPDMLARAILALGSENVVEELIRQAGAEMIIVQHPLICSVGQVLDQVAGQAIFIGFRRLDGTYRLHPPRQEELEDDQLIFLIDVDTFGSARAAEAALTVMLQPLIDDRPIIRFKEPAEVGLIGTEDRVTRAYRHRLERQLRGIEVTHLGEDCWSDSLTKKHQQLLSELEAVILLADDPKMATADAKTFLAIRALRTTHNFRGRIIAEAVLPENRARFEASGATDVLRPVTRNLDIIARCVLTGAEEVLDSLYSSYGEQELVMIRVNTEKRWGDLLDQLYDLGLGLAYEDTRGLQVVPPADALVKQGRIYVLLDKVHTVAEIQERLHAGNEAR